MTSFRYVISVKDGLHARFEGVYQNGFVVACGKNPLNYSLNLCFANSLASLLLWYFPDIFNW